MKKGINIILGISFLILLSLIIWINYLMKNNIGDIDYDSNVDNSSFKLCNEERVFQYYSVGTEYEGERKALRNEVFKYLSNEIIKFDSNSGYITFRFIINCNGKSGRYRVKMVNEDLKETVFKKSEIEKLKTAITKLKKWKSGKLNDGTKVDSYYQINFKIEKGSIIDIF